MTLVMLIAKSKASDLDLANETGIHPTLIWRYRRGDVRPGPDNAVLLQRALGRRGLAAELADILGVVERKRRRAS